MRAIHVATVLLVGAVLLLQGNEASAQTPGRVLTLYSGVSIPGGTGRLSIYNNVDGYRYVNIFVEWNQTSATEAPVSLSAGFDFGPTALLRAFNYATFDENRGPTRPDPQRITVSGANSWGGTKSSYIARVPVMGPYLTVQVWNEDKLDRTVSVMAYLTP